MLEIKEVVIDTIAKNIPSYTKEDVKEDLEEFAELFSSISMLLTESIQPIEQLIAQEYLDRHFNSFDNALETQWQSFISQMQTKISEDEIADLIINILKNLNVDIDNHIKNIFDDAINYANTDPQRKTEIKNILQEARSELSQEMNGMIKQIISEINSEEE